jgi:hypothetical protein
LWLLLALTLLVAVGHGHGDDVLSVKLADWNGETAIHLVEDSIGSDRGEGWGKQKPGCGRVVVSVATSIVVIVIVVVVIVIVLAIVVVVLAVVVIVVVVVVLAIVVVVVLAIVVVVVVVLAIGVVVAVRLTSELLTTKLTLRSTGVDQDSSLSNAEADVGVCIGTHILGDSLKPDRVDCWILELLC